MRGTHCLRHWSSTQPTIALSSGEAELGGISKGMSHAMGLRSIVADLGITLTLNIKTDATCHRDVPTPRRRQDQALRHCALVGPAPRAQR